MSDASIPAINYHDFVVSLEKRIGQHRYPYSGSLEVTPFCNLRCVHCYVSHCEVPADPMNYQDWARIIDEMAAAGSLWILFTGGEPFLRPDFLDIYTYAKKKGFLITIFTNGTLITPAIADYLLEWQPRNIEITLYGATKPTYESVTGVPGSYDRCIRAIDLLLERHLPLQLKTVAITTNWHEIGAMTQYAEKLGVHFKWDAGIMPRIDHGLDPTRFRLSPEQIVELELSSPERLQDWTRFCDSHWGPFPDESLYLCGAGRHSFFVDPYGRLSLCLVARKPSFDLREGTLADGWNSFIPCLISQRASPKNECRGCELIAICGRCAAWAELENADPNTRVSWLCRVAQSRVNRLGLRKAA